MAVRTWLFVDQDLRDLIMLHILCIADPFDLAENLFVHFVLSLEPQVMRLIVVCLGQRPFLNCKEP